jgi:hypothetical protein
MTISLKANAAGNAGQILIGATPVVSLPVASGIPFMKNILINGNLAINQRGVTIAAAANGAYGPDRWKKVDASNMTQIVEAGNFQPATVYTLSGIGVTTQQITSPASGNWTIPNVPITATNIQLEEGEVATPFEMRNVGFELSLCQRYYEASYDLGVPAGTLNAVGETQSESNASIYWIATMTSRFSVPKRVIPQVTIYSSRGATGTNKLSALDVGGAYVGLFDATAFSVGTKSFGVTPGTGAPLNTFAVCYHWAASAEL